MARTNKTPKQWQQLIESQKRSGLSIAQYCQQHSLSASAFYTWRKRLSISNEVSVTDDGTDDWLAIDFSQEPTNTAWNIELLLPNGVVLKMSQH
jgi:putative transposase